MPIGELPPVGEVPPAMHAQVIRQERFGEPRDAFRPETLPVPSVGPGEVVPMEGIPDAHQRMGDGVEVFGNRVALVGASAPGLGAA